LFYNCSAYDPVQLKLSLRLIKRHALRMYGEMEVKLHIVSTSPLKWIFNVTHWSPYLRGKEVRYLLVRELDRAGGRRCLENRSLFLACAEDRTPTSLSFSLSSNDYSDGDILVLSWHWQKIS